MKLPVPCCRRIDFAALLCEVKFIAGPRCSVARSNSNRGSAVYGQRTGDVMKRERLLTASSKATVSEAARLMAGQRVSAVVVVDDGALVGIFTERDAVFRVIALGRDPLTTHLCDVMTRDPATVDPERTFGHALQQMHAHGVRHMPVVTDGKPVGIVTARDALDPELEEFVAEARRREAIR